MRLESKRHKIRDILKQGFRYNIGNRMDVSCWEDAWIPDSPNFKVFSQKPENCQIYLVSDMILPHQKRCNVHLIC